MCDYNRKFPIYLTNNIINYLLYYFYVSLLLSFVLFLLDSRFRMWPPTQLIVLWSLHIIVLNNSVFIITHYYAVVQISIIFTFIDADWCVSIRTTAGDFASDQISIIVLMQKSKYQPYFLMFLSTRSHANTESSMYLTNSTNRLGILRHAWSKMLMHFFLYMSQEE